MPADPPPAAPATCGPTRSACGAAPTTRRCSPRRRPARCGARRTPGTKHWRVDLLEADTPAGLATATPRTVLAGDDTTGVKDPVLHHDEHGWHLWASVHPLESWDGAHDLRTELAH